MSQVRGNLQAVGYGLGLACFAAYQQFKLAVALPVLLDQYGYARTLAGAFMSVYALAGLLLSLPLARLIARRGALGPILIALFLFVAGSALTLAFPAAGMVVLAARGLEGIGFAALAIAGPVLANTHAAPQQLPVVIGLTAAWIPVGQLLATLLVPVALVTLGWRLLWYLAMVGCAAFALWTLGLAARRVLEPPGAERGPAGTERDANPSREAPLRPAQRRALILAGAVFMLWSGQYFAYMTWLPQYLVEVYHLATATAAWSYVIPVSLVGLCAVLAGVLLRAGVDVGLLLIAALATQAAVWWLLPLTGGGSAGILSLIFYGSSGGIAPACLFAMPSAVLQRRHGTAAAFGIVMTGRNLGVLIGPVLLAEVFQLAGSWQVVGPVFGALTTLCLALGVWLALRVARTTAATAEDSPGG